MKEVRGKSLLPVVLLVVVAMFFASYLQPTNTGKYIYPEIGELEADIQPGDFSDTGASGGPEELIRLLNITCPGQQECRSSRTISGQGRGSGSNSLNNEAAAKTKALDNCKKAITDTSSVVDKCISVVTLDCLKLKVNEKNCIAEASVDNKITSCKVVECDHIIISGEEGRIETRCKYKYDGDGKRIEPGDCREKKRHFNKPPDEPTDYWHCWADDGTYKGKVKCNPPPKPF